MSIDDKLDAETVEFMRKSVSSNSREQQKALRKYIVGMIAVPVLREKQTLKMVLSFLDEALDS